MRRPITCPKCGKTLGCYDTANGLLQIDGLPLNVKVFGAYIVCDISCGMAVFNGQKLLKRLKKEKEKVNAL